MVDPAPTAQEDSHRGLVDATVLVALTTSVVFLVGFIKTEAYYDRFGLSPRLLGFTLQDYMAASLVPLLWPVVWLVTLVASLYVLSFLRTGQFALTAIEVMASAAATSVIFAGYQLAALGDPTSRLFVGITLGDAALFALAGAGAVSLLRVGREARKSRIPPRLTLVLLALMAFISLLGGAAANGADRANDKAWGCVDLRRIDFEPRPSALEENRTYWLVAETPDRFYVRDVSAKGNQSNLTIIEASAIDSATLGLAEATRPGCSGTRWPF